MLENASPLEVGWTISALFGLLPASILLVLSVMDEIRRRRRKVNGPVRIDVHKNIAVAIVLFFITGCYTLAGLVAMQSPPNPLASTDPQAAISPIVIPLLIVASNVVATLGSGFCLLQREALEREVRYAMLRNRRSGDRVVDTRRPLGDEDDGLP